LRLCWQYIDAILRPTREPLTNLSASLNNLVTQFGKESNGKSISAGVSGNATPSAATNYY
jgi:hypothetical protein